jgi:hypothetical protein
MKSAGMVLILAGLLVFAAAVAFRLMNLQPLINEPVTGLWKVSVVILLAAIAVGVNKK